MSRSRLGKACKSLRRWTTGWWITSLINKGFEGCPFLKNREAPNHDKKSSKSRTRLIAAA